MGVPLVVFNHTRKQYVTFCSTNIGDNDLAYFLSLYIHLIKEGKWNMEDCIQIKNKNMEYVKEKHPEKWGPYQLVEKIDVED